MSTKKPEKFYFMQLMPSWLNYLYADIKFGFDKLMGFRRLKRDFYNSLGYHLDLEKPRSFNEKIQWKKLYDRNPLLPLTADKYRVRSYVKDVLGDDKAQKLLIPIYQAVSNPEEIRFENLPEKFVIKPNHGSGMHLLVKNKEQIERRDIIKLCKRWLYFNYGLYQYEWAYRHIERLIIIEKLIECTNGGLPIDYKFYCFHGKCSYIRLSENRFDSHESYAYYDPGWNQLNVNDPGYNKIVPIPAKPDNFEEMLNIAEKLSEKFDAVRIDLFNCNGTIYFGEISHYDSSGMAQYDPADFDFEKGGLWKITKDYWEWENNN